MISPKCLKKALKNTYPGARAALGSGACSGKIAARIVPAQGLGTSTWTRSIHMTRVSRCLVAIVMLVGVLVVGALSGTAAIPRVQAAELPAQTAEAAVETYIRDLLGTIEGIKPLYESDRAAYFTAVEAALTDFVDFTEVARGVMAKYGTGPNGATPEQLQRFADVFRASLVDFYGSALANYGGASFELVPLDTPPSDPANATNVRMNIIGGDGSKFEVEYTMFVNAGGVWKLKNLYVEGVNLRRQFYAQFDSMMQGNNFDIDKVIDNWKVGQ
jgi:phospholipid transport system substrate-binding protein